MSSKSAGGAEVGIENLKQSLNSFDPSVRGSALEELLAAQPGQPAAWQPVCNMHCHTFFSFNAYGYSPTGTAWLARENGWPLMGLIDFDVLDGVDEFLAACDATGIRGSCGIETRAFFPEFSTRETSSPGEPGVFYHIGLGFTSSKAPAEAQPMLDDLRKRSRERNLGVLARVNGHLAPISVDYERDVLPLTPAGNATERHMVEAYIRAVESGAEDVVGFWADRLNMSRSEVDKMMSTPASYRNTVRMKLMKKGGVGYVQPDSGSFPGVDQVTRFIEQCGALPCYGWVDGFSEGEQAVDELLSIVIPKGVVIANIVPDRNWNYADSKVRAAKAEKLNEFIATLKALDLPINVGTEMNSPGNRKMDDFDAPEMQIHRQEFLDGAYFIYGHTVMARFASMGYQSTWSKQAMSSRRERNQFYTAVGKAVEPGPAGSARLASVTPDMAPTDVLKHIGA
jgi:hypothetical protein